MEREQNTNPIVASAAYAALRQGGAPPDHARAQLGLRPPVAAALETCFLARQGAAARHEPHVRDVLRAGGFPDCGRRQRAARPRTPPP